MKIARGVRDVLKVVGAIVLFVLLAWLAAWCAALRGTS